MEIHHTLSVQSTLWPTKSYVLLNSDVPLTAVSNKIFYTLICKSISEVNVNFAWYIAHSNVVNRSQLKIFKFIRQQTVEKLKLLAHSVKKTELGKVVNSTEAILLLISKIVMLLLCVIFVTGAINRALIYQVKILTTTV